VLLVATAAIAVTALAGCDIDVDFGGKEFRDTYTETVAVTEIRLDGGSGELTVRPGVAGQVEISRVVRYRGDTAPTERRHRTEGTALMLSSDCGRNCSISYTIAAPRGVKVTGHSDSGNLELSGVSTVDLRLGSGEIIVKDATGSVRLEADSGNIDLTTVDGTLWARTGSGEIRARDVQSDTVTLTADSGNIDLTAVDGTLSARTGSGEIQARDIRSNSVNLIADSGNIGLTMATPADVQIQTGSGEINLNVPTGDYQVDAQAGSGEVNIDVPSVATAANLLHLRADSGNISVRKA